MADTPDLGALIATQIRANGPITVADYMQLCLSHPRHGYYRSGTAIGASGDFITAPEISQVFGELIGFFVVNLWQQLRQPPSFTLLELGPGRGVLMEDALRAASRAPGFLDALHLQLFESSVDLRAEQQQRLGTFHPYWAPEIDAVGDGPLFVVANEFFDALPVRQFVHKDGAWHERLVGLRDDQLAFGLSPATANDFGDADDGAVREIAAISAGLMNRVARKIAEQGGAILVIDYGYEAAGSGETLQAVRDHAYADPLAAPGETDISTHVDFSNLRKASLEGGLKVAPLATQGDFLRRLGAVERTNALAAANPGQSVTLYAALERLVAPGQMGTLFKVLCAHSAQLEPAGFA